MRVPLDNCVPIDLAKSISGHEVKHAREMGWHELGNGSLLAAAELKGFDILITTDKKLRFQQNMSGRRISVVVLSPRFVFLEHLLPLMGKVLVTLENISRGSLIVVKPENSGRSG